MTDIDKRLRELELEVEKLKLEIELEKLRLGSWLPQQPLLPKIPPNRPLTLLYGCPTGE